MDKKELGKLAKTWAEEQAAEAWAEVQEAEVQAAEARAMVEIYGNE